MSQKKIYEEVLLSEMEKRFSIAWTDAVKALDTLKRHSDIYQEFLCGMQTLSFTFPHCCPVMAAGFTAEALYKLLSFSELDAYLFLIRLRDEPETALKVLEEYLGKSGRKVVAFEESL